MTAEQKDMIATYITTFKNLLARHLKPNVAIKTSIYPTPDEVLIQLTLNRDNKSGVEWKKESASAAEAIQRAGVDPNLLPESDLTHKVGLYAASIVSLKTLDEKNWTSKRAADLVDDIIKRIRKTQQEREAAAQGENLSYAPNQPEIQ